MALAICEFKWSMHFVNTIAHAICRTGARSGSDCPSLSYEVSLIWRCAMGKVFLHRAGPTGILQIMEAGALTSELSEVGWVLGEAVANTELEKA